ncbi:MAG: hypothetical protein JWP05_1568, partial [Microbacteriaceae bacterium]|nr:hypothetical protein [Microbacteriaceae bacterium]
MGKSYLNGMEKLWLHQLLGECCMFTPPLVHSAR